MTERELQRLIASDSLTEQQLGRLSNAELAELRRILLGALANHLADGVSDERRAVHAHSGGNSVDIDTRKGRAVDTPVTEDGQKVYTGA